jgi:hypothetical protein
MPFLSVVVKTGDSNDVPIRIFRKYEDAVTFKKQTLRTDLKNFTANNIMDRFGNWDFDLYGTERYNALAILIRHVPDIKAMDVPINGERRKAEIAPMMKAALSLCDDAELDQLVNYMHIDNPYKICEVPFTESIA